MEIVLTHMNMDFDSLSAQFALTKLYPACRMVLGYPLTGNVRSFLALNRSFLPIAQVKYLELEKITRFFMVDCQSLDRLDSAARKLVIDTDALPLTSNGGSHLTRPITIFDHHLEDPSGLISIATNDSKVERVGAATTILVERIRKERVKLSAFDATVLAIGIFEDTGCLTYHGTTPRDAECIAFLIKQGADLSVVREYIKPKMEQEQVMLFEKLLGTAKVLEIQGNRVVLATAQVPVYIDGLATITRQLMDLEAAEASFCVALMKDRVHIVGRADPRVISVRRIVQEFGGDGHPGAGAAVVKGGNVHEVAHRLESLLHACSAPQPRARDVMVSPVRTVRSDISMDEAGRLMTRYGLDGLVVAENEQVVGIVSRRDIDQSTHHKLGHARVAGFMSKPVISVTEDTTLSDIQQIMVAEDIGRLPVLAANGALVGLVSRQDVLNSLFGVNYARDRLASTDLEEYRVRALGRVRRHTRPALGVSEDGDTNGRAGGRSSVLHGESANLTNELMLLDDDTIWLCRTIGSVAQELGMSAYAVGGFVRDLLLQVPNFDLDYVIEGAAQDLAAALILRFPERFDLVATHGRFQTATLHYLSEAGAREVDLSTARTEFYEYPAALPEVEPSKLEQDLLRRDFTINALAICVNPNRFGNLVDHFHGLRDLERRIIRILHPFSFIEDPTRMVRAARFAGRLGFHLDPKSKEQARRASQMGIFNDLGGVRIKAELKMILDSPQRLKSLNLLADLSGNLCYLDSQLEYGAGVRKAIRRAERLLERFPLEENWVVYLGALLSELPPTRLTGVLDRLQLTNKQKEIIEAGLDLHRHMPLSMSEIKRSELYEIMHSLPREALAIAAAVAEIGTYLRRAIKLYLEELAFAKLEITGDDLIELGFERGPKLGLALKHALAALLDGQAKTSHAQLECAVDFLKQGT
jgi:tRNA nucleotidyltransferase (CCA-adding enzyme)